MGNIDFAKVLETLKPTELDDERARLYDEEQNRAQIADWIRTVRNQLPPWQFARFGNQEWAAKVHPRVLEAAKAWRMIHRDPSDERKFVGGEGIVLSGKSGCGKSSALVARIHEGLQRMHERGAAGTRIKRLPSVAWVTEADLVKAEWERVEAVNRCIRADACIVDEVGFANGHHAPNGHSPVLMQVVFGRYDLGKPTSITTGLSIGELGDRYGSGLSRRLIERAKVAAVV